MIERKVRRVRAFRRLTKDDHIRRSYWNCHDLKVLKTEYWQKKNTCCVFDDISLVLSIMGLLKPSEMSEVQSSIQGKRRPLLLRAHQINVLHVYARPSVSGQNILESVEMGSPTPPVVFTRHCPFCDMPEQRLTSAIQRYQRLCRFVDSLKRWGLVWMTRKVLFCNNK